MVIGLSACGAPAYNYVADDSAGTFYKVPSQWHQLSQKNLDAALTAEGLSGAGSGRPRSTGPARPRGTTSSPDLSQPFVFAEVGNLNPTASNEVSYNMLRDFMLPVTSSARSAGHELPADRLQVAAGPDDHRRAGRARGSRDVPVHVPDRAADTFDEDSLTNADQTVVYYLLVHCTNACYTQNQNAINTVMTSFTIGSRT